MHGNVRLDSAPVRVVWRNREDHRGNKRGYFDIAYVIRHLLREKGRDHVGRVGWTPPLGGHSLWSLGRVEVIRYRGDRGHQDYGNLTQTRNGRNGHPLF